MKTNPSNPTKPKYLYKLLNIPQAANNAQIEKAFKKALNLNTTNISDSRDENRAIFKRLKEIEEAYYILTDTNQRSSYDAHETYNFIQNYAWKNNLLKDKELPKLKYFWAKQHVNRELRSKLNFDAFIPELDLIWYLPFFKEEYYKDVQIKNKKYPEAINKIRQLNKSAYLTSGLAAVFSILTIFFAFVNTNIPIAVFTGLMGILGITSSVLLFKQYKTLKSSVRYSTATVIDKWIDIKFDLLGNAHYKFYLAFKIDNKTYRQTVSRQMFTKNKTGATAKAMIFDGFDTTPVLVEITEP